MSDTKVIDMTAIAQPAPTDLGYVTANPATTPVDRKAEVKTFGRLIQAVNTQTGAVATGTTTIPFDDTIPQITEGTEFMTLAITPTNAANKLRIRVVINISNGTNSRYQIAALFQDATAGALQATSMFSATNGEVVNLVLEYTMTAGTIVATTFRVRAGSHSAGTTTFNGVSAARIFGGVYASSITIEEYVP